MSKTLRLRPHATFWSATRRDSVLHTDESRLYTETGKEHPDRRTVKHSASEYVRNENGEAIHSSTVKNVFSVFKRGMTGGRDARRRSHARRRGEAAHLSADW
jgi:hypothetical protein